MALLTGSDITQQALIEHTMLRHLVEGLRAALEWRDQGDDYSRKVSTLRFFAQSFQRHLERLLALEEFDGYLDEVAANSPWLARQVERLRGDHGRLREATRRAVNDLEQVSPQEPVVFGTICAAVATLLEQVEKHSRKEMGLLQETFDRDIGGEG
jgi:hemerythrin-like domain-containing protein